ncbi:hypothetical protein BJX65DRAFT_139157 [Aspergillus insuetus]
MSLDVIAFLLSNVGVLNETENSARWRRWVVSFDFVFDSLIFWGGTDVLCFLCRVLRLFPSLIQYSVRVVRASSLAVVLLFPLLVLLYPQMYL